MGRKGSWYEAPTVLHRERPDPELLRALVFSLAAHLVLIGVAVAVSSGGRQHRLIASSYRVGLASPEADSRLLSVGPLARRAAPKVAAKSAPKPKVEAKPAPKPKVEAKPTPEPKAKPAPKPKAAAKPAPEPKAAAKPAAKPKAAAKPAPKPKVEPKPEAAAKKAEPAAAAPPAKSGQATADGQPASRSGRPGGAAEVVRDATFVRYYNVMIDLIREHWVWVGNEDANLSVTVRFGIGPDGTIQGIERVSSSGNPHFDQSVENAVRGVARFAPPPVKYRRDFADVELVFHASDLVRR